MSKKPEAPKVPDAPDAPEEESEIQSDDVKVKFIKPCNYAGKMKSKGDVITVTLLQAEHLDSLGLIK